LRLPVFGTDRKKGRICLNPDTGKGKERTPRPPKKEKEEDFSSITLQGERREGIEPLFPHPTHLRKRKKIKGQTEILNQLKGGVKDSLIDVQREERKKKESLRDGACLWLRGKKKKKERKKNTKGGRSPKVFPPRQAKKVEGKKLPFDCTERGGKNSRVPKSYKQKLPWE